MSDEREGKMSITVIGRHPQQEQQQQPPQKQLHHHHQHHHQQQQQQQQSSSSPPLKPQQYYRHNPYASSPPSFSYSPNNSFNRKVAKTIPQRRGSPTGGNVRHTAMAQITRIGNPLSDSRRNGSLPCYRTAENNKLRNQWWFWMLTIAFIFISWNSLAGKNSSENAIEKDNNRASSVSNKATARTNSDGPSPAATAPASAPVPASEQNISERGPSPSSSSSKREKTRASATSASTAEDTSKGDTDSPKPIVASTPRQKPVMPNAPTSLMFVENIGMTGKAVESAREMSSGSGKDKKKHLPKAYNRRDWPSVTNRKCFTQGLPNELRPSNPIDSKLPKAIVLGESRTLHRYLNQHKALASVAFEQNFLDTNVDAWVLKNRNGIPRKDARAAYAKSMTNSLLNPQRDSNANTNDGNNDLLFVDWSTSYLFNSDKIPSRIKCIVPWVKVIGVLQNPIDRALAQYYEAELSTVEEGQTPISFEDYVLADIAALFETGVLQDWKQVRFDEFSGSVHEQRAWRAYTLSGVPGPVGRGLYSIMIQQYLDAMPDNSFLFMPTDDWKQNAQESYRVVLEYLELPRNIRTNMVDAGEFTTDRRQLMTDDVKHVLQRLFEPYNRRLETLLGEEWAGIWKE